MPNELVRLLAEIERVADGLTKHESDFGRLTTILRLVREAKRLADKENE